MKESTSDLENLIAEGFKYNIDNIYCRLLTFFDFVGQVHSVVRTDKNNEFLRVWCGKPIEQRTEYMRTRAQRIFKIKQDTFREYIVKPCDSIGNTVKELGSHGLMDIDIFDEHRNILPTLKSGDYVVITNIHYASFKTVEMFVLHGGAGKYKRGIRKIPLDFHLNEFQHFRQVLEKRISNTKLSGLFEEFSISSKQNDSEAQDFLSPFKTDNFEIQKKLLNTNIDFSIDKIPSNEIIKPCKFITLANNLIAVDFFVKNQTPKYCFLTNAKSTNCEMLDSNWKHPIYCSSETAKILPIITKKKDCEGVSKVWMNILEIGVTQKFDEFEVTLFNANHCSGSVMFLFEGKAFENGTVLCTGDFRAEKCFIDNFESDKSFKKLKEAQINLIYFDNTNLHFDTFPTNDETKKELLEKIRQYPKEDVYIPLNILGQEQLLEDLSRQLNEPFNIYEKKLNIIKQLNYYTSFGVPKTRKLIVTESEAIIKGNNENNWIVFHLSISNDLNSNKKNDVKILFSEHSSKIEVCEFFRRLSFADLIPTKNPIRESVKNVLLSLSRCTENQDKFLINRENSKTKNELSPGSENLKHQLKLRNW